MCVRIFVFSAACLVAVLFGFSQENHAYESGCQWSCPPGQECPMVCENPES